MNPTDPNQNQPTASLINPQQKQQLAATPDVLNLPITEQQKKVNELADKVMKRVFQRIVNVLVETDMKMISELDKSDTTGNVVKYFLMTKVPNLELIIQEEIEMLKRELQTPPTTL